jgi:large subunit ribosomal protein L19
MCEKEIVMDLSLVDKITQAQIKDVPYFEPGCTVKVHVIIKEGDKTRIQVFEGVVIAMSGKGIARTFTVRKMSSGIGVERTFPINSPIIDKIEVVRWGKVRRAKLFYLRGRSGKASRIEERRR